MLLTLVLGMVGSIELMDIAKGPEDLLSKAAECFKRQRSFGRDDFWILEEWYYIPLLNLFTVSGFEPSLTTIARRLGLNIAQVADALAQSSVRPLPCDNESDREFGRTASQTGSPIRSRPVMLATRVMPNSSKCGATRWIVCAGEHDR